MKYMNGNMRTIMFLLLIVCCASCTDNKGNNDAPLRIEVCNETLVNEITEYQKKMLEEYKKDIEKGDSVYALVYFKEIQDSIFRFSINIMDSSRESELYSPLFFSYINNKIVFFYNDMSSMIHRPHYSRFFSNHDAQKEEFAKRYFPNETRKDNEQAGLETIRFRHPTVRYLTFIKDSLIDKQEFSGCCNDKIKLRINGKEVWL